MKGNYILKHDLTMGGSNALRENHKKVDDEVLQKIDDKKTEDEYKDITREDVEGILNSKQ